MATHRIALPRGYRIQDVLAFHSRDAEGIAEQVTQDRLRKAVLLGGVPVLLDVTFAQDEATCRVDADAPLDDTQQAMVADAIQNILGLRIDPERFMQFAKADPLLGPLARRNEGLRIVQSATVFEALTWAVIGQQINLTFAIALRRTFIQQAGRAHSSGLLCYPEARDVARIGVEALTSRKFSRSKAETLLRLAQLVDGGALSLDRTGDIGSTSAALLAVKGVGPWTVNYALLRGYGYEDCSLHGDVAVRSALQKLSGAPEKPSIAETEQWLAAYAPHRTMVAAHLWASL